MESYSPIEIIINHSPDACINHQLKFPDEIGGKFIDVRFFCQLLSEDNLVSVFIRGVVGRSRGNSNSSEVRT